LQLTAPDLLSQGIIDRIVPEPMGGAHTAPEAMAETLKEILIEELSALLPIPQDELVNSRIEKFSSMGVWNEEG